MTSSAEPPLKTCVPSSARRQPDLFDNRRSRQLHRLLIGFKQHIKDTGQQNQGRGKALRESRQLYQELKKIECFFSQVLKSSAENARSDALSCLYSLSLESLRSMARLAYSSSAPAPGTDVPLRP